MPDIEASSEAAEDTAERDARALAARYRYPYLDLASAHIDGNLFRSIPVELMFRHDFVPIAEQNGSLEIAIADPSRLPELDEIASMLGKRLRISIATLGQISDLLNKTEQSQRVLEEVTEEFNLEARAVEDTDETLSIDRLTKDSGIAPVIKLIDTTVFNALERRASDIHIETRNADVAIKYRIDGALHFAMPPISKDWHETILSRIKVMSELDIAERRIPQDGRFRVRYRGRQIDFRVSIMPTVHGEDAVLRILDKQSMGEKFKRLSLDVVGFSPEDRRRFAHYIREPYGMVLVTGPTGSGKTTTLYAALSEIQSDEDKIVTIEDPVEYQLNGITQIPINEKKGLTFARGLRSILRHDPDKIMVGEIRDPDTAQIAIQSALTGHLGLHDRTRQQRGRRPGALPEHGRGGVQLRLGPELHPRSEAGAGDLPALPCPEALPGREAGRFEPGARRVGGLRLQRGRGLHRVFRDGFPRPNRDPRAAGHVGPYPRAHPGQASQFRDRPGRTRGGHADPSRVGRRARAARRHHSQGNRQGDVHRLSMRSLLQFLDRLLPDPQPALVFEIGDGEMAGARRSGRSIQALAPAAASGGRGSRSRRRRGGAATRGLGNPGRDRAGSQPACGDPPAGHRNADDGIRV